MPYAPIDEHFDEHPKFEPLELEHYGLMACALTYCNRNLTDGKVSAKAVRTFGASGRGSRLAARLVELGIWLAVSGGWEIVGYLDHNPSKATVLAKREASRARKEGYRKSAKQPEPPPIVPQGQTAGQTTGHPPGQPTGQDAGQECPSQGPSRAGAIRSTSQTLTQTRTNQDPLAPSAGEQSEGEAPEWFASAIATVEMGAEQLPDHRASWLRYSSHRRKTGKPMSRDDAVYWLTTVDVKEAREERSRRRGSGHDAAPPAPRDDLNDYKA